MRKIHQKPMLSLLVQHLWRRTAHILGVTQPPAPTSTLGRSIECLRKGRERSQTTPISRCLWLVCLHPSAPYFPQGYSTGPTPIAPAALSHPHWLILTERSQTDT
jgi:hypothetical protein